MADTLERKIPYLFPSDLELKLDAQNVVTGISGYPVGGGGGTIEKSDLMWKPTVASDGYVHWTLDSSATTPEAAYISGAQGPQGQSGESGYSPTITTATTADAQHPQSGVNVTVTDIDGNKSFNIWNGINGQGTTVNLLEGDGIQINHEASTTDYTISVSADYSGAATAWVNDQNYLTSVPTTNSVTGDGITDAIGLVASAEQALLDVNNKIDPADYNDNDNYFVWKYSNEADDPSGWYPLEYAGANKGWMTPNDLDWWIKPNSGLSAKWDETAEKFQIGISTNNLIANTQYAWTTSGWKPVQGGGGGTTYTAGDGIDITNDVISFNGATLDPVEAIIVGDGTIEHPLSTSAFYNVLDQQLDNINDAIGDLADEIAALGGTIVLRGRASCSWINNQQAGSFQTGDAYIATDSGLIWSYDHTTGQGENINVSVGDMVVLINYDNNREVALLATTPNLDAYAQKTELPVVEGGANVVVTETTMSTGAKKYTVAAIGGGSTADMSYLVNSSDQRIDVTDAYDQQTNCRTFTLSANMPHFEAVTAMPETITPNTYYFVYEE